jgi:hypothetical protein
MLRPLACTRLRIVLLPRKPGLLPAVVHSIHNVNPESSIEFLGALLVRARLVGGVFLSTVRSTIVGVVGGRIFRGWIL